MPSGGGEWETGRQVVPGAQVAKSLLHHPRVVNDGDDPHRVLANGAAKRINVPHAQNQVAPALGGELGGRWRGNPGAAENQLRRQAALEIGRASCRERV